MAGFVFAVAQDEGRPPGGVIGTLRQAEPWLLLAGGPGIGFASDEFPVIFSGHKPTIGVSTAEAPQSMDPTTRPTGTEPPRLDGGVVALRRFDIRAEDASEFVELSAGAWLDFERLYEARILGLFRMEGSPSGAASFLLTTWYASLAEWERSRGVGGAEGGAEAARRFQRRRELTVRTDVRVGVPL